MRFTRQYFISTAICIINPFGIAGASAQTVEAPAEPEVQSVKVTGVRDPDMMPYKDAYEILTRVHEAGKGLVDFKIRVVSKQTRAPIKGLELSLAGETTFEKVPVSDNGSVNVPLKESAYADKAEFVTNQKRGTLDVHMSLLPKLTSGQFSYSDIVEAIAAGQRVRKVLIPWYLRLFVPSVKAVAICYPDKTRHVMVSDAPMPVRQARVPRKDGEYQLYCAEFEAGDRSMAKHSVIAPAPGWQARYL